MDNNIAIDIRGISKKYMLHHEKPTLAEKILSPGENEDFWALKNINFEVKKGERIGIIGPNGAGKSTLLKIISKITTPTEGEIYTFGRLVALIDMEAGFHPELTGEENIYLNGMLIGMSKGEIKKKRRKIISFADIGGFIDAPFYTYSDGMKFRLALSIALASNCDILVMDEIFTSGDVNFQKKTIEAIRKVQDGKGVTTIVTSHIPALVWPFSDTFYFLDKGRISKVPNKRMRQMVSSIDKKWRKSMQIEGLNN